MFVCNRMDSQADTAYKRKENWGNDEVDALVQAVTDNRDILTAKLSIAVTAARKAKAWEQVALRVNAVSSCNRNLKEVKKKWQSFQSSVKAKECKRIKETSITGGGPSPKDLSDVEKSALTVIPTAMLRGISGGLESGCDDDTCCKETDHAETVNESGDAAIQMIKNSNKGMKRKSSDTSHIHEEDFHLKLLKIEERKLQIEEERILLERERTEALKEIAFVLQARQIENLLS